MKEFVYFCLSQAPYWYCGLVCAVCFQDLLQQLLIYTYCTSNCHQTIYFVKQDSQSCCRKSKHHFAPSKTKCLKWPIHESFHPQVSRYTVYTQCKATHLTDVKFSSSPESPLNFISQFTLHLYMKTHFLIHTFTYFFVSHPHPHPHPLGGLQWVVGGT